MNLTNGLVCLCFKLKHTQHMKKISRFLILAVIFSLSFVFLFSILPAIVWIFGGSFTAVSQHFAYVLIGGLTIITGLACLFAESFNEDFYTK